MDSIYRRIKMYEFHNENTSYELIYCEYCKHKWAVEKYERKDGKWIKNNHVFKRFDTLEEAKEWVLVRLRKEKKNG